MKNKLIYMLAGAMLIIVAFLIFGSALAGPKQCPPGQRGNCDTYIKKGIEACFPANTNTQGWDFVHPGCDDQPVAATDTDVPPPLFTQVPPTRPPFFPSPTITPGSTITVIATKWTGSNHTSTPTAFLLDTGSCPTGCLCGIGTELAEGNDLKRTEIAIELAQNPNSCPAP